jgi:hypothetical protein
MRRRSIAMLVAAAVTVAMAWAGPIHAERTVTQPKAGSPGQWRLIGTTEANHTADHDAIVVAGPFDNFRRIKFKVTDAPLNMQHMVVTYDNGAPDRIEVREDIPQGGESRVIDLRGVGKRSIRKIEFWYDTKGFLKGKANVTVFGMK